MITQTNLRLARLIALQFTIGISDGQPGNTNRRIGTHPVILRAKARPSEAGTVGHGHGIAFFRPNIRFAARPREEVDIPLFGGRRTEDEPFADERSIQLVHRRGVIRRLRRD